MLKNKNRPNFYFTAKKVKLSNIIEIFREGNDKRKYMVSQQEITSTEKLLNIIQNGEVIDDASGNALESPSEKSKIMRLPYFPLRKRSKSVSVGVDISDHELRMVKVIHTSVDKWNVLDYRRVQFRNKVAPDSSDFIIFLKSELSKFCGSLNDINIWGLVSSDNVEVQNITIPKVGKKEVESAVYWTAKKKLSFERNDTALNFEIQGEVIENGVSKLAVLVYTVPESEVRDLRIIFDEAGFTLSGIAIVPLAIQNILRTKSVTFTEKTVATLYIGKNWSHIDIFSGGDLVMTRGIKSGINSMTETLMEEYNEREKDGLLIDIDSEEKMDSEKIPENIHMDINEAEKLLIGLGLDASFGNEVKTPFNLDNDTIYGMVAPALERLTRQVERTIEHYTITLKNENISTIYVYSAMNIYKPIVDYISDELGIGCKLLDPLNPENLCGEPIFSHTLFSDRVSCALALGLALSDSHRTPNLLFTYKDKEKLERISCFNNGILCTFVAVMIISVAVFLWLNYLADQKNVALKAIEQELVNVNVDEKRLPRIIDKLKQDRYYFKALSKRYIGMAAIGELSVITPSDIRLFSIKTGRGDIPEEDSKEGIDYLIVNGVVKGSSTSLESTLVTYVLKLQASPMFDKATISRSEIEPYGDKEVLNFILNVTFA